MLQWHVILEPDAFLASTVPNESTMVPSERHCQHIPPKPLCPASRAGFSHWLSARQWATRIQKWRISKKIEPWLQNLVSSSDLKHVRIILRLTINWSWKSQLPTDPLKRISCGPLRICTLYNWASILAQHQEATFFGKASLIYYSPVRTCKCLFNQSTGKQLDSVKLLNSSLWFPITSHQFFCLSASIGKATHDSSYILTQPPLLELYSWIWWILLSTKNHPPW